MTKISKYGLKKILSKRIDLLDHDKSHEQNNLYNKPISFKTLDQQTSFTIKLRHKNYSNTIKSVLIINHNKVKVKFIYGYILSIHVKYPIFDNECEIPIHILNYLLLYGNGDTDGECYYHTFFDLNDCILNEIYENIIDLQYLTKCLYGECDSWTKSRDGICLECKMCELDPNDVEYENCSICQLDILPDNISIWNCCGIILHDSCRKKLDRCPRCK